MRLGNISKVVAVAASVIWAAGCSTTSTTTDSSDAMAQPESTTSQDSAAATGTGSDGSMSGGSMNNATQQGMSQADVAALSSVFYFDFDKAVIQSQDLADLNAHAEYLLQNANAHLVLEGHADERGTREYNMALGERRAKAVARYLAVQGAAPSQIETVSYGEERPAVVGHNEESWGKNRRVELKYSH